MNKPEQKKIEALPGLDGLKALDTLVGSVFRHRMRGCSRSPRLLTAAKRSIELSGR
jgi:hypothetical protein